MSSQDHFEEIIAEGHPERVLFALSDRTHGAAFIQGADDEAFSRAFEALDPAYFFEPYVRLYRNLDPHLHTRMEYRLCRSLEDRWNRLLYHFDKFMGMRRESGMPLTLGVYRHLLRCAGAMGDEHLAKDVFETLMPEEGVEPDRQCFNYYLQARVWSAWYEVRFRNRTRVIQSNLDFRKHAAGSSRKKQQEMRRFRPDRIAPTTPEQIRQTALATFQELNRRGFRGNEETYVNLMLAMNQAGDLAAVKSVLKSVWNVNIELLLQYDEEEIEGPTYYEEDSPLRPTGRLLSTIVHIFANQNNVSLAYTLLDYVSRNYNLRVPEHVWFQLYEVTFVLSSKRGWGPGSKKYAAKGEYNLGQLESDTLGKFFDLITDEPHNVEPDVVMLIMMARIQRDKRHLDSCLEYVRRALVILEEEKTTLSQLYDDLLTLINNQNGHLSTEFLEKRHNFILGSMSVEKHLQYILRMVYHLLQEHEWAGGGKQTELSHRRIPDLVREFETFLPNHLNYPTPTGHVRFANGRIHREYAIQLADDHFHARVGRLRQLLDTENYDELVAHVEGIPEMLAKRENWCFWCQEDGHHERDCKPVKWRLAGVERYQSRVNEGDVEANIAQEPDTREQQTPEGEGRDETLDQWHSAFEHLRPPEAHEDQFDPGRRGQ